MAIRIVVSDSSCLIDIRKASLLDAFLKLVAIYAAIATTDLASICERRIEGWS